ncbi:MAG: biopolymer transporter ExbD [Nitrospina sp.]|jgi:biopolymer transport protein ExbD|nr:biopolymer transporter ExbD [Nitrospina sp.]MBT3413719.1 biopolymer transporter ExbD [Nitrospina sp.]MBT3856158.1 biopolymer transporter ExbD [Nitrospina sp.]MBT4105820.1 biopolymer transporter ExbD [Nitrospina sp.]MBT4390824.1 biopolymer transporter ExbD [Nitrospina sp.]
MIEISKPERDRFQVDLAPLIDVVFLLLIFFMLTFAVAGQGLDLSLPQGESQAVQKEPDLIVRFEAGGDIFLGERVVALDELGYELEGQLKERKNKLVVLEPDKNTHFDLFTRVLDLARKSGAKDFAIVR